MLDSYLPPQKFGFRRHVGTQDAIHVVMSEIERRLASSEGMTYAIFIDCQKAFDLAPRQRMINAFKKAGVNGQLLKVIESFYQEDHLQINVGGQMYVDTIQNRGTPQGDPLSWSGFSLLLAELPKKVTEECRTGTIAMFADDIIITHRNRGQLQLMLNIVSDHLEEEGLHLNPSKTMVMKIRRGGHLNRSDRITWKGKPLEFVPTAKYLGIRLQTTGTCFTEHIDEVCCKNVAIMYAETGDPYKLSVSTAVKLFYIKALPKLSYGMGRLRKHLTLRNLQTYEKCFCAYLKRVLRVARNARNRYLYVLADLEIPFVEVMRVTLRAEQTEEFCAFVNEWKAKVEEARKSLDGDPILQRRKEWSAQMYARRHVFTRYLVHDYHDQLCSVESFHEPTESCVCRFCGQMCIKYHAMMCEARPGLDNLGCT